MSRKVRATQNGYWFDDRAADAAVDFFRNALTHVKGEWAGESFVLQEWQRDDIIRPLFGWRRPDGTRRYRTAWIEIPRKNGKSTLVAGIALYLLYVNDIDPETGELAPEPGAEVYSAAADREQAGIVFDLAKQMVEASPFLYPISEVYKRSIIARGDGVYKVLSADVPTKHGLNVSGVVVDEVHAHPNRDLIDVLTTGTGARRQPLIVFITTAGVFDPESIYEELHHYAEQILEGVIRDDSFFALIRAAGPKDDWLDEEVWKKANPGLGVTVKLDYLRDQANKARLAPAFQNTFKRLHLNMRTQQLTRWLPMEFWDMYGAPFNVEALLGLECYGGLDLASTIDIAAFVLDFPLLGEGGPHIWLPHFWIPRENMKDRIRRDRVPYDLWVDQGLVTATEGNAIDYAFIRSDIEKLKDQYDIREIAFDRFGAVQMSQELGGAGFTMIAFGQGFVSMSPPTVELLRLTVSGKLIHGGNPVLRWMADNLDVSQDPAGNVKPDKKKSRAKIDGIVAGVMGLDRAIRHGQGEPGSVYEERGLLLL